MFRRKWSSLPADPSFPSDLEKLGYFINEDDEVRSIENPNNYFKYFLSRNERYNERQRFAMSEALESEIHARLADLGLQKILLPLGATDPGAPHVPIFASADLATTEQEQQQHQRPSRAVLVFGETAQDLGVLAHRVAGGPGGVARGSMVSVASALRRRQRSSAADARPPGVVLANPGQLLWWWPPPPPEQRRGDDRGKSEGEGGGASKGGGDDGKGGRGRARAMTRHGFHAAPMRSAVHQGALIDERRNRIPQNRSVGEHVRYIFEAVVPALVSPDSSSSSSGGGGGGAKLDIVAVGDAVDAVARYLDQDAVWSRWEGRIGCFANVGGYYPAREAKCAGFARFLRDKARAYIPSLEPLGTVLSGPDGNPRTTTFTQHGCPVISGGTEHFTEMLLVEGRDLILDFLQEVALSPGDYKNPEFQVLYYDIHDEEAAGDEADQYWTGWREDEGEEGGISAPKVAAAAADGSGGGGAIPVVQARKKSDTISERIVETDDGDDGDDAKRVDDPPVKAPLSRTEEDLEEKEKEASRPVVDDPKAKPERGSQAESQANNKNNNNNGEDSQEELEKRLGDLEI